MNEVYGSKLIVYVDGQPIAVANDFKLTLPDREYPSCTTICPDVPEWNLTVSGRWPELTRLEALTVEWRYARLMPRKKKKAYRKRLSKAISYEVYREHVNEILNKV